MRARSGIAAIVVTGLAVLGGCAGGVGAQGAATSGAAAPNVPLATDPFGCGIVVAPATAVVGEDIVVSRPPTGPGDICTTLAPGTTQTLELRSVYVSDSARQTTTVTVGADGSFEARMPLPSGLRLGRAVVTAIPPAESDCTAAAAGAGSSDECYFPRAQFTVAFDPEQLSPLLVVATDVAMPPLPADDGDQDSYALAGPRPDELTLVIFGSGCASRPAAYRRDATNGNLEIVSEVIVPAGQTGCNEPRIPWTSVIEVPAEYRDYTAVKVDNLDTVLLG